MGDYGKMIPEEQYNNLQVRARIRKIARAYVGIYDLNDQIKNEYIMNEKDYVRIINKANKGVGVSLAELDRLEKDLLKILKNIK